MPTYTQDFFLSWDEFQYETKNLIRTLREKEVKFDKILAVTRGGLFPAGIIARELGILMVDTICVSSYNDQTRGEPQLLKPQSAGFDESVLVIDDLTDTGATFAFLRKSLPKAHFAALFIKPQGASVVDTYSREIAQATWVRFPWDTERAYAIPIVKQS